MYAGFCSTIETAYMRVMQYFENVDCIHIFGVIYFIKRLICNIFTNIYCGEIAYKFILNGIVFSMFFLFYGTGLKDMEVQ